LFTVFLVLASPAWAYPQIIVGDAIPLDELAQARAKLERATPKTLTLEPGEFEVLEPTKSLAGPLLWLLSNEAVVQRIDVAAQQPLGLWMKRRGEPMPKLHQFPAKAQPWVILIGAQPGNSQVMVIRNGSDNGPPVVVDTLVVSVGGPAPGPPTPPVEDDLTKALRAAWLKDAAANQADKKWIGALAGIYDAASRESLDMVKTAGDLDTLLNAARQAAGIPEPEVALPHVRQRIRQELLTQLRVPENGASQPFTVDDKRRAQQVLSRIARALEVLSR
jgi:hypothetical protein